jgi:hypothetical protein
MWVSHFRNLVFRGLQSIEYTYPPEDRTRKVVNKHLSLINLRFFNLHHLTTSKLLLFGVQEILNVVLGNLPKDNLSNLMWRPDITNNDFEASIP